MKEKEIQLPTGITPEMVAAFKAKYGENKVFLSHITAGEGNSEKQIDVIIRSPDRTVIGEFEKWSNQSPLKAREILVNNCLLTGREAVQRDDDLFFAVSNAISDRFPKSRAISEIL